MAVMQRLPLLICPHCDAGTLLPYRNLEGSPGLEPYWPLDSKTLALSCHKCWRLSKHSNSDIRFQGVEANPDGTVFWRLEFSCGERRCDLHIVVYTRTDDKVRLDEITRQIPRSLTCSNGHEISEHTKLEFVQQIEWVGEDQHIM